MKEKEEIAVRLNGQLELVCKNTNEYCVAATATAKSNEIQLT